MVLRGRAEREPYEKRDPTLRGKHSVGRKASSAGERSAYRRGTEVARAGDRQPWKGGALLLLGPPVYSLRVLASQL